MPDLAHRFQRLIAILLLIAGALLGLEAGAWLDYDRLLQSLTQRFGQNSVATFNEWRQMLAEGNRLNENEKLQRANDFFNRRIYFDDDIRTWGQNDYWATPIEFIGKGSGDCEDFAIAKYYSLIELGIPITKLRLVYVRATQNTLNGPVQQGHMVLAYYSRPSADPLILDNLVMDIRPASMRSDLSPVFSFNSAGIWMGTGNQSSRSNLSRWQDLLARARAEGFE